MTILKTTNGLNGYRPELMNGYAPEFVNGYAPEFSELSILCSQPKSEKVIKSGKKQYRETGVDPQQSPILHR